MCLIVLAWQAHPRFRLIVAANRDEFHERPTAPIERWDDPAGLLAGRDLRAGGTWLGVRGFAFGAITNFREPLPQTHRGPSRGALIPQFIESGLAPQEFLRRLEPQAANYAGFNLLLSNERELAYASNRSTQFLRVLEPGIYGLSNHTLDTPWPKLERIRAGFSELLEQAPAHVDPAQLLALLDQREPTPPGTDFREALGAPFVVHPLYGTRSSSVVLVDTRGEVSITERRFDRDGTVTGESSLGTVSP